MVRAPGGAGGFRKNSVVPRNRHFALRVAETEIKRAGINPQKLQAASGTLLSLRRGVYQQMVGINKFLEATRSPRDVDRLLTSKGDSPRFVSIQMANGVEKQIPLKPANMKEILWAKKFLASTHKSLGKKLDRIHDKLPSPNELNRMAFSGR